MSFRWDIDYGPANYLLLVLAQIAATLLSFAATWLATRLLGPSGYGSFVAILAASMTAFQVAAHWTTLSLARFGCEEFVETGRLARTFWTRMAVLLPNLLLVLAAAPWWLPRAAAWLHIPAQAAPLVLAHLLATAFWLHVQYALQAAKLPRVLAVLLSLERALIVLSLLGLFFLGISGLVLVASAYIISPLIACAAGLWRLRALVFPWVLPDRAMLRRILTFSFPLIPTAFFGYLTSNHLDAFFIVAFLSSAHLGVYAVAYQLGGALLQFPTLISSLLLPLFVSLGAEGEDDRLLRFLRDYLPVLTLLWSIGCALFAVLGGFLLIAVFGDEFQAGVELLWPLMAAFAFAGPILLGYSSVAAAKGKTSISAVVAGISACVNIFFNLLLIPRFGLLGCAWATVATIGVSLLVWTYFMRGLVPGSCAWTLRTAFPPSAGAAWACWKGDALSALAVAGLAAALIGVLNRREIALGGGRLWTVTLRGLRGSRRREN